MPWARLGVDTEHDFEPLYVISPDRKQQVSKLKALVKDTDEVYLATDEDREGEAIAWHLVQTLDPKVPVRRMVFHEITPDAIAAAVAAPRDIDERLVDAQETRRILDRLYGYEVSPVLWKKVLPRLSAGRVQSVATRIVVERERARMLFKSAEYWDVEGTFRPENRKDGDPETFSATLVALDDRRVATGRDFDPATGQAPSNVLHLDEAGARGLAARLDGRPFEVVRVEEKPYRRRPYAPFMTSTLQQEGSRKLRWSSATTMRVAQRLYENGYITYMRTDSTNLSETALAAARQQARELYGDAYVPAEARTYSRKVKNAQEAHEAIRPAGDSFRTPGELHSQLSNDEFRLYELIWQRTLASQMADAVGTTVSVRIAGISITGESAEFTTSGRTITFPGFLRAYVEDTDEVGAQKDDAEKRLPQLEQRQGLTPTGFEAEGHSTSPPARYTEASLVKALEELGIGRPSTYASIMQTIQDRGYVWKKGSALVPSWTAFAVIGLLGVVLRPPRRLRVHGKRRERPRLDRRRHGVSRRVAAAVLLRRQRSRRRSGPDLRAGRPEAAHRVTAGGDRRAGRQLDPTGRRRGRAGRALRAVPATRRGARVHPGGSGAGRTHSGQGRGTAERTVGRPLARHRRRWSRDHRQDRPVRALRHRRGQVGVAVQDDVDRHGHAG